MSAIDFDLIRGASLYEPSAPAPGEALLFYLLPPPGVATADPPPSLTADAAWDGAHLGYFVFLDVLPDERDYAAFESALKGVLPADPPNHTGLVWARWTNGRLEAPGVMSVSLGGEPTGPVLAASFATQPMPGIRSLAFADETPIAASEDEEGNLQGLLLRYPPQPPTGGRPESDAPWSGGVLVPLSGELSGCFVFAGLENASAEQPRDNSATKQLFDIRLDPLRPFDPDRTRIEPTGLTFVLDKESSGAFQIRGT